MICVSPSIIPVLNKNLTQTGLEEENTQAFTDLEASTCSASGVSGLWSSQ